MTSDRMDDERLPEPEPSGALVPPPTYPPTAIATDAPLPPRRPVNEIARPRNVFRDMMRATLDTLDHVGDKIAAAMGMR
jgi:hypothetical protein